MLNQQHSRRPPVGPNAWDMDDIAARKQLPKHSRQGRNAITFKTPPLTQSEQFNSSHLQTALSDFHSWSHFPDSGDVRQAELAHSQGKNN